MKAGFGAVGWQRRSSNLNPGQPTGKATPGYPLCAAPVFAGLALSEHLIFENDIALENPLREFPNLPLTLKSRRHKITANEPDAKAILP